MNITINQGATWATTFLLTDSDDVAIDLTGATVRMQLRTAHAASTIFLTPTIAVDSPATAGSITAGASATITAGLTAPSAGVWDLEVVGGVGGTIANGTVVRVVEGTWNVSPEVTR